MNEAQPVLPLIEDVERYAIFLDFDGTIVEIEDYPDAVRVEPSTLDLLKALHERSRGAFAIISGREISVVDRLLHPLKLPVAGVHGVQRRDAFGETHMRSVFDLEPVTIMLENRIGGVPGVVIERKPGAVAIHYRLRPELEETCRAIAEEVVAQHSNLRLLHGKMVYELMQRGGDKGSAISAFLSEPPFKERIPLFAGDDITDEAGFLVVNAHGGVSIKVGDQMTAAQFSAPSARDFKNWLRAFVVEPSEERNR